MSQEQLTQALQGLLDKYTMLVNSGDAGNWDPEEEPEVIAARAAISATQPAQAAQPVGDAFTKAIEIRTAQGWKLTGEAIPVLYTDTINDQQVMRDDVWLCTTAALKPAQAAQGESDVATWLWLRFADYCRNQGMNPHHQNDLFAIVHDLRAMLTSSPTPPAQQGEPT